MKILEKEFKYNSFFSNIFLVLSVICILIIFYVLIHFKGHVFPLKFSLIMPIIAYFVFRNYVVLKVCDDRLEVRIAPLRSAKLIDYNKISSVDIIKNKIIIDIKHSKPVKIPVLNFNQNERDSIISLLRSKI